MSLRTAVPVALALLGSACVCVAPVALDGGPVGGGSALGGGTSGVGGSGGGGGINAMDASTPPMDGGCISPVPCYTGGDGTRNVGPCRAGLAQCHAGVLGPCIGEVVPSAAESCNGVDDDCNGAVDDGLGMTTCGLGSCQVSVQACTNGRPTLCVARPPATEACDGVDNNCDGLVDEGCGCVYVSLTGNAQNNGLMPTAPVNTIMAGIAVAFDAGIKSVCISGGLACSLSAPPVYAESIKMRDGITLVGGYQESSGGWVRSASCRARIQGIDATGVLFDQTIGSTTGLASLQIFALDGGSATAITIDEAQGAVITGCDIQGGGGPDTAGIRLRNDAVATITQTNVNAGSGSATAFGIDSDHSQPTLVDNCPSIDPATGWCTSLCSSGHGIRGRITGTTGALAAAVRLSHSKGAVISRSLICGGQGTTTFGVTSSGDSKGMVVRQSHVEATQGDSLSIAVQIDSCGGNSPWLFDNHELAGGSPSDAGLSEGVNVSGLCPTRIDSNRHIVGGGDTSSSAAIGVHCTSNLAGEVAACDINGNANVVGATGFAPSAAGAFCELGACRMIADNTLNATHGVLGFGLVLDRTGAVVRRNDIRTGCVTGGAGVLTLDAFARVENNAIVGPQCSGSIPQENFGVRMQVADSKNEVDLHSNTIFAGGAAGICFGAGVDLTPWDAGTPKGPRGMIRNNIVDPGPCSLAVAIAEEDPTTDPRFVENNDLLRSDAGVYLDEGTALYRNVSVVNVLSGAVANISVDPAFLPDGGIHLSAASQCIDVGTLAGAPPDDYDGDPRIDGRPDLGADEYHP